MKNQAFPRIELLDEDQIRLIHQSSLRILSTTGLKTDSALAYDLLSKATGKKGKNNTILIPPGLVEWAIESAPSNIRIFNRQGKPAFQIGADFVDNTVFGIGVTNTHYQDTETGKVIPFAREHMVQASRLGEYLGGFDLVSTIGIPSDVPVASADLYGTLEMYANTIKPLVLLIINEQSVRSVFKMLTHLHGNLAEKPAVLIYVNPITPLIINESTVNKIIIATEYGCPVVYSNYSMYGATAPIVPAGALALMNAELLAGLVLCQLIKKGAPVILGSLPASFDMKTMASPYTPQSFILNLACAEMMAFYRLPHCGTSGSGGGWGPDLPAGDMLWINHLTSCLGKIGMAPFVGGNLESLVFSPATVIYSDQIIHKAREIARGLNIDGLRDSEKEILTVGPGGNFLTTLQTLKAFESPVPYETIWPSMSYEKWEGEGKPEASERLQGYSSDLMKNLKPPEEYENIIEKGEVFIGRLSK